MSFFKKRVIPTFLLFSLVIINLSGCAVEVDPTFSNTEIKLSDSISNKSVSYTEDYISKDIAIVNSEDMTEDDSAFSADSCMLVNISKNEAVYAKDVHKRLYPASTTKVITALLALENCDPNETVTFSYAATHITEPGAMKCGFEEGDKIKLKNLLFCMMLFSGNDAAQGVAEHVAGSVKNFSKMMNKKAAEIGASDSHFVNPHGLHSKRHYTTAYDLYLFFNQALKYKLFRKIINTPQYQTDYKDKDGGDHHMICNTTNQYIKGTTATPKGVKVIGGKTGTTSDAGACLIICSKNTNTGEEFVSVVLKAFDHYQLYTQMTALLEKIE
ncbi:MAG: serine hydrolase [Lachnospiraceae bacterium]|nr:serine hydrolase [Lachnospiraceae bacterium]